MIFVASGKVVAGPVLQPLELSVGSSTNAPRTQWTVKSNYEKLHEWACLKHEIATFLIDNPHNWIVSDTVRLEAARQVLAAAISASTRALLYAEQNDIRFLLWSHWADGPTLNRVNRMPTWLLFRNLLDAQARLGKREDFEQTVAKFTRAVEAPHVSLSQCAPGLESPLQFRSAALELIAQKRAQLHQVRGEWAECAKQRIASLSSMVEQIHCGGVNKNKWQHTRCHPMLPFILQKMPATSWELRLGLQVQLANEFAALSYARQQQPSSAYACAAVLDAQHAVALLHAAADGPTLTQLLVALDAAAKGQQTNASVRIGDVAYDKLMSPPVLDQVRKREAATPGVSPRGFLARILELAALVESFAVPQARAHARLTAVAAVYQQLGLVLRAAGQEAEAQRAFDFAVEMAAMRPVMGKTAFSFASIKGKRSLKWYWLGLVVLAFPSLGAIFMLHKLNEQRCVLPALHADDADYKRGGGCLNLCARPLPSVAANGGTELTGAELVVLLKREISMPTFSVTAISKVFSTFSAHKSTAACLEQIAQEAAAVGPDGRQAQHSAAVFHKICNAGDSAYNLAVLLVDSPRHWKMSDEVRLRVARQLLAISAQCSAFAIRYADKHESVQSERMFSNWHAARPDRVLPTWDLWTNLLNAQARLGLRDEFERTAARLSQTVAGRCDKLAPEFQTDPDKKLLQWARAFDRRLICEQRAQLRAVRGEWADCVQQRAQSITALHGQSVSLGPWSQHVVLGGLQTAPPRTEELGFQLELAGQLAALSHARLQQRRPAQRAAVVDAQRAVALLSAGDARDAMNGVLTAMMAEAAAAGMRINPIPTSDCLSKPVFDRVRQQQAPSRFLELRCLIPVTVERIFSMESLTVLQARSHARLSLVAAVYQQLGLALRADGQTEQAQRAFNFADEMAAMRPALRNEPRAKWMIR